MNAYLFKSCKIYPLPKFIYNWNVLRKVNVKTNLANEEDSKKALAIQRKSFSLAAGENVVCGFEIAVFFSSLVSLFMFSKHLLSNFCV